MKKIIGLLSTFILTIALVTNVNAQDLQISTEGFQGVGENEVHIIKTLSLNNAEVYVDENFKLVTTKQYTQAEITNGTFNAERTNQNIVTATSATLATRKQIITDPLQAGEHNITGNIVLKWYEAAQLQDDTKLDVTITINNIIIKTNRDTIKPIILLHSNSNGEKQVVLGNAFTAHECNSENLTSNYDCKFHDVGASYDVTINMTKAGTTERINKNMIFGFNDIDSPDSTPGTKENPQSSYQINENPAPYTEGITLISGVTDNVYLKDDNLLNVSNTSTGSNTKFTGTKITTNTIEKPNEQWKAGFITRVNAGEFKFRWQGSNCGTALGFLSPYKVETKTEGEYPNNVTITSTDSNVMWKENKQIEITPDTGYTLSKVKVDGEEVDINTLTKQDGKYVYTFNSVVENHSIVVEVTKNAHSVTTHHYKQGTEEEIVPDSSTTETKYINDPYQTSPLSNIPEGYELVGTPGNATGTMGDSDITVIYEYKLKDVTLIVKHVDEQGNEIVPSQIENKKYGESYSTTPMENDEYELIETPTNAQGTIKENTEVTYVYKKKAVVPKTGQITVRYVDEEGKEIDEPLITTKEVGNSYTSQAKEIEGYELKQKPSTESYTYTEGEQIVTYVYSKIKLKIDVKVKGIGGTIEGAEEVLYGNDSTKDKIVIKADKGYYIDKVTINGKEIGIPSNSEKLSLSNFLKMTENKLIEVSFKEKPKEGKQVVSVPKTSASSIIAVIIGFIILIIASLIYYFKLSDKHLK